MAEWCGYFVSYVTKQAGVPLDSEGEGLGAVDSIRRWAIQTGRWRARGPRAGDLWIKRNIGHVGIVERAGGGSIVSLDGNYDDRVARTHRSRSQIAGFVRLAVGDRIVGPPPAP
ncbi:MAG: CHAP domain-containing protein [Solirubrobacteraceae bacterium]